MCSSLLLAYSSGFPTGLQYTAPNRAWVLDFIPSFTFPVPCCSRTKDLCVSPTTSTSSLALWWASLMVSFSHTASSIGPIFPRDLFVSPTPFSTSSPALWWASLRVCCDKIWNYLGTYSGIVRTFEVMASIGSLIS